MIYGIKRRNINFNNIKINQNRDLIKLNKMNIEKQDSILKILLKNDSIILKNDSIYYKLKK